MKNLILSSDNGVNSVTLIGEKEGTVRDAEAIRNFIYNSFPADLSAQVANLFAADLKVDNDTWIPADKIETHFNKIRATFPTYLPISEVQKISGALGYALAAVVRGDELSLGKVIVNGHVSGCVVEWDYDTTKSKSDDPDFEEAFERAKLYMVHGSPIRKTDVKGVGTKGTRLVEGIGSPASGVEFYVK